MSMMSVSDPYNRRFTPSLTSDNWNRVTPYSSWDRRDVIDPFAGVDRSLITPELATPLARCRETVNTFSPLLAADIIETENDFHVHVDLPGVAPEDLQVSVNNGFLEMCAERKQIHQESNVWSNKIERSYGRVSRRLALPDMANDDSAECTFRNGVLTVSFSKAADVIGGRRTLEIK